MYTFLAVIAVALILMVGEVFFNAPPVVQNLFNRADRLRTYGRGRAYFSLLVLYPILVAAAFYALGTVAGLVFGFAEAWADVGTFFVLIIFLGIMGCFFSFLGDLGSLVASKVTGKPRGVVGPETQLLTTIVFTSAMYGSLVAVALKVGGYITFGN